MRKKKTSHNCLGDECFISYRSGDEDRIKLIGRKIASMEIDAKYLIDV